MIKVNNVKLPLNLSEDNIKHALSKSVKIGSQHIKSFSLHRLSIDARDKQNVHYIGAITATLDVNENKIVQKCKNAEIYTPYVYKFNPTKKLSSQPVVVGSGPAGLFAAYILALSGEKPVVIERGKDVDSRTKDIDSFFENGRLDTSSNIQFGEGGAGTFSDGKLNTGTNDSRATHVLRTFVKFGAQEDILINAKPHIGTDVLKKVIRNMREEIISLGGSFLFETRLTDISIVSDKVKSVTVKSSKGTEVIDTENLILAIGHSARDTFEMLLTKQLILQQKPFSMGVRIEHSAEDINKSQYGSFAQKLPTADYKLNHRCKNGRGVYTFCMCPGGFVVNASSEEKRLCTNGMSLSSRDGENSNSAVLVGVSPEDFSSDSPLVGMHLQQSIEEKAFLAGGGDFCAPVETVGSFLRGKENKQGSVKPTILPGVNFTKTENIFPEFISESLKEGLDAFSRKLSAFSNEDAILTAAETRSSSPVRIMRNENCEAVGIKGLYPCGEGAGYAGGIVSAAVDGIKCAEKMLTE